MLSNTEINEELIEASRRGNVEDVQKWIVKGADVNYFNYMFKGALQLASLYGHINVVRCLLENKADPNVKTIWDQTPLHIATKCGKIDVARCLLTYKADPNVIDLEDHTPLHIATKYGEIDVARCLLANKADPNVKDKKGLTALQYAFKIGNDDLFKCLLENKADPNVMDELGHTPLHIATESGNIDVARCLLAYKANPNVKDLEGNTPLHLYSLRVRDRPRIGMYLLFLSHGADLTIANNKGKTVFDIGKGLKVLRNDGLPLEVKMLQSGEESMFKSTMSSGSYMSFTGKIMIVGNEGVGKTAITCALIGKKTPRQRKSTEGIDVHYYKAAIDEKSMKLISKELNYEDVGHRNLLMTEEYMLKKMATLLTKDEELQAQSVPIDRSNSTSTDHLEGGASILSTHEPVSRPGHESLIDIHSKFFEHPVKDVTFNDTSSVSLNKSTSTLTHSLEDVIYSREETGGPDATGAFDTKSGNNEHAEAANNFGKTAVESTYGLGWIMDTIKRLFGINQDVQLTFDELKRRTIKAGRKGVHNMNDIPIIILDFAGQEVFYSSHQSFLTHRGVYIIVLNGSLGLDEEIETESYIPGRNGKPTGRGYIKFWVDSILTYSKGRSATHPKIVICFTHKDKVPKKNIEERRSYLYSEVEAMFNDSDAKAHLSLHHKLFVNALDQKEEEMELLKDVLVELIQDQPSWGEKNPKAYVCLEMVLNQNTEKGLKCMSIETLKKANANNPVRPLTEEELNVFLKLHHSQGDIIHFPLPHLKENIITDPRYLIDAIKSIITDQRFCDESRKKPIQGMHKDGILYKKDVMDILKSNKSFAGHEQYIIDVLKHLDILAEPRVYTDTGTLTKSKWFFVPSMVKKKDSHLFLDRASKMQSSALGMSFKFHRTIVPPAIGFRMIASCLDMWRLKKWGGEQLLFSGMAVVAINESIVLLVQIKEYRIDFFLIHEQSRDKIVPDIAASVRDCLSDTLKRISNCYQLLSTGEQSETLPFISEYTCPNIDSPCYTKHPKEELCCHGEIMTDCSKLWVFDRMSEECSMDCVGLEQDALDKRPSEAQLANLSTHVTWQTFRKVLLQLELTYLEIGRNENDYEGNVLNVILACLLDWRKKFPNRNNFANICNALESENISKHTVCKVFRNKPMGTTDITPQILERRPTDEDLDKLSTYIIRDSFLVAVQLGIDSSTWLEMKADNEKIVEINRRCFRLWRDQHAEFPKLRDIAQALWNVGTHIESVLK